jgi:lipopolysaccharide cholinephosphotransferase
MKRLTLDEAKIIQVSILDYVHNFCIKNNINYSLSSGTLIGAVRHKGYIPWDDDIDLYMLRKDYDNFIKKFCAVNHSQLKLHSINTHPNAYFHFIKISDESTVYEEKDFPAYEIGINIDIFPIDFVPNNTLIRKVFFKIIYILNSIYMKKFKSYKLNYNSIVNMLSNLVSNFISLHNLIILENKIIHLFSTKSNYICNVVNGIGINGCFSSSAMESYTTLLFEGKYYNVMSGYKEYLTKTYGDYMKLPPEDQRINKHQNIMFKKDTYAK